MDYSYYQSPAQLYHFAGLPPTPAHSYEATGEQAADEPDAFHASNGFQGFDQHFQFNGSPFIQQQQQAPRQLQPPQQIQQQQQQQQTPPLSDPRLSIVALPETDGSNGSHSNGDYPMEQDANMSSEEEKEHLSPAQSRRKAQNRAAANVDTLQPTCLPRAQRTARQRPRVQTRRPLRHLHHPPHRQRATQNEILRATTSHSPEQAPRPPSPINGPLTYTPTDFVTAVGVDPVKYPVSYAKFDNADGERRLAVGATWDYIQGHEMFRRGMIDVTDVCRRLKGRAACDGRGPVFRESEIKRAIEESVMSAGDELI